MPHPMDACPKSYVAVVDDDESACRSFARLLGANGFQPVTYPSAESFLEDVNRPRFDCLVLDIQLGGISGLELGRRLAAANDATPIVFITAHDDPAAKADAEATGYAGFFSKTSPGKSILDTIRAAVRRQTAPETQSDSSSLPSQPDGRTRLPDNPRSSPAR